MGNLISILAILFFSLFVVVYLLERFGSSVPNEKITKLANYIIPLMALVLVLQAIRFFFF